MSVLRHLWIMAPSGSICLFWSWSVFWHHDGVDCRRHVINMSSKIDRNTILFTAQGSLRSFQVFVFPVFSLEKTLGFFDCEVHAEPVATDGQRNSFFSYAKFCEPCFYRCDRGFRRGKSFKNLILILEEDILVVEILTLSGDQCLP